MINFFVDDGIFRYFQRVRNNEICEARGVTCKATMDLFETHLRKPTPIPKDLYQDVNYTNNLNWLIMSSEGTGKKLNVFHVKELENIKNDVTCC